MVLKNRKSQKNKGKPPHQLSPFIFDFPSTYCPQQARQQKGYQLQVGDSGETMLPQIFFPIRVTAKLIPQQAKLFRIQRLGPISAIIFSVGK